MDVIAFQSVSKVFGHQRGLFKRAATDPSFALRDISLRVSSGSVLAVLGPNGSGKTTLLKLISTMLLPDQGRVLVHGSDTRRHAQQVRSQVGFAISGERSFFPRLTARENLEFFAALDNVGPKIRRGRIGTILARTGLLAMADIWVSNFSSGMYQKLAIARALMKPLSVLLLDEPTRSLDPVAASEIRTLVRELSAEGTTVVIASHNFEEVAAVADSVLVLRRGKIDAACGVSPITVEAMQSLYSQSTEAADIRDAACVLERVS
ncbi:MAG TPA: ABC transporter ATP-binding protein [Terriglobales bacterium]|nr:ABC transporter ATP-binding protein [Terriglobales bacterium]